MTLTTAAGFALGLLVAHLIWNATAAYLRHRRTP